MASRTSLLGRGLLALVLLVGFYLLAVGIAGALLWIPYAEVTYANRIQPKVLLFCVGGAGAILWSLRPRVDRFEPPGPRLDLDRHPRLASEIKAVADATGQAVPAEVFLVPDVNAFVAQRGGVMGVGSRRVMGLGLPLMSVLTVREFKAVLAHEFGHYHGGDVAIGPLVYRTRSAIGRTLQATAGTLVEKPFVAYATLFLKVSSAVSRHQEREADALAARTVGADALACGLRKAHDAAPAFMTYMGSEVVPLVRAGFAPPIAAGFQLFFNEPRVAAALRARSDETTGETYDSHPPLAERLAALQHDGLADGGDEPAATTLLDRPEDLEFEVFRLNAVEGPRLEPIAWPDAATAAYLPHWQAVVQSRAPLLDRIRFDDIPTSVAGAQAYANDLREKGDGVVAGDEVARRLAYVLGAALGARLHASGWSFETGPGRPLALTYGEESIAPMDFAREVIFGTRSIDDWRALCAQSERS